MSVIGRKPYVNYIIDACSKEQVETIVSLMDNLGEPINVALYGQDNLISNANKGVHYVSLAMEQLSAKIIKGILVYIDTDHCGFFGIATNSDNIEEFRIHPDTKEFDKIREYLTVEELRQVCGDALAGSGSGGDDGKEVNIIEFTNIDLDPVTQTASLVTDADAWEKFFDTTEECIVLITQSNGSQHTLSRSTVGGDRAIFSTQSAYGDGLADWTATFMKIGDEYTGTLAYSTVGEGGLPPSTKANQVLVSNSDAGWDEKKSVPLADNLLATPETNDALYSKGPTGGLADIATGEESYLSEVKGYTIIWNQLIDNSSITLDSSHIYIVYDSPYWRLKQNTSETIPSYDKCFDLTLMFGGNDKIPFSLNSETEYPTNGSIPAQTVNATHRFLRLFANVDLVNAPYDPGTPKNVKATKLTEVGQNLWDENDADMVTNGLALPAGYRYEVYLGANSYTVSVQRNDGTGSWQSASLTRYQRGDGKYVYILDTFYMAGNIRIKPTSESVPIKYVGFVHSGNYCLTTGTLSGVNSAMTNATIPAYSKHEYAISGIDGLNGLMDDDGISVYDTKDMRRVGSVDLSTLNWTQDSEDTDYWYTNTPSDWDVEKVEGRVYLISNSNVEIDSCSPEETWMYSPGGSPTGILFYPLATPIATGEDAFEPISIDVNDMGMEFFTQPSGANCPVNQVSLYYANLKDKLVNLKEPIEVSAASFSSSNSPLEGLKIGDTTYKLIKQGNNGNGGLAIGTGTSSQYGSWNVAIGGYSYAQSGNYSIAIGYDSYASGGEAITTIGYGSRGYIPYSVSFDGDVLNKQKTISIYSPSYIFFRNEVVGSNKTSFAAYTSGHYLSEYIQLNELAGTIDGTGVFTSTKTFGSEVSGIEVVITCKGSDDAARVSGIIEPYDTDFGDTIATEICIGASQIVIYAYMNSTGNVVVDLAPVINDYSTFIIKYHLL